MIAPWEVRDWQHKTLEATTMVAIANIPKMKEMVTSKILKLPEESRSNSFKRSQFNQLQKVFIQISFGIKDDGTFTNDWI